MKLMDDLIPMKLYSAKKRVMLPVNPKDKKHGSAIFLMSPSMEINQELIKMPYLFKGNKLFRTFYIDRNVAAYIDSNAINIDEELQEAAINEGIIHTDKSMFTFENVGTMDTLVLDKVYNKDTLKWCMKRLGMRKCPVENIVVQVHSDVDHLQKSFGKGKNIDVYSYTDRAVIHILSTSVYDEEAMDGPYDIYCLHELIYCLIINEYPNINRKIARCTAMALSGQVEWLRKEKEVDQFKYYQSKDENIDGLYAADVILGLYNTKGGYGIKKFLEGDMNGFYSTANRRVLAWFDASFKESFAEGTLTAKEKAKLKDSDYGIPSKKKYPMPDEAHVKAAIRMFNHCSEEDEEELARAIKRKMKQYNITDIKISDKNRLSKYVSECTFVSEGYIINREDSVYNLNIWKPGVHNVLYVTGLSGGGKTTTAYDIAAQNNAIYIELDRVEAAFDFKNNPNPDRVDEQLIDGFIHKAHITKNPRDMDDDEYVDYFLACFSYMLSYMKKDKENLYVVEGIQVIRIAREDNSIFNEPIIIKNTSMVSSMLRRLNRDKEIKIGNKTDIIRAVEWYLDQEYSLGCLRKAIKSRNESVLYEYTILDSKEPEPSQMGFYSGEGEKRRWNSIVEINGKKYRERSEILLIKDGKIFISRQDDGTYKIPGGGTEPEKSCEEQCARECQEEAFITPKNLKYVLTYKDKYSYQDSEIGYVGHVTYLYIGEYDRKFTGNVAPTDRDSRISKGDFYEIEEIYDELIEPHKEALMKYFNIHEAGTVEATADDIPYLEFSRNGELFAANHDESYYDVLEIMSTLTKKEHDIVSLFPVYRDVEAIKKRIVLKDPNGTPMSFMDIYWFKERPHEAQITTAVSGYYRGHNLCAMMLQELLDSDFTEEYNIATYIWNAHPDNEASKTTAISKGFMLRSEDIDSLGRQRYEYHTSLYKKFSNNDLEKLPESAMILDESTVLLFQEADDVEAKYDKKLRRYLYKERLKNNRAIFPIYEKIKANNPDIDRTYRDLKLYKAQNVYVDTSYYHGLYLENVNLGRTKRAIYMYIDFLTRLMDTQSMKPMYTKFTYFFPAIKTSGVPDMLDWKADINILSVICYLAKRDPDRLKKWGVNKRIVFLGYNGYIVVDFSNFGSKDIPKFKNRINKLLSNTPILDEDPSDEDDDFDDPTIADSKGSAIEVLSAIEQNKGIKFNDISRVGSANRVGHLIMNTDSVSIEKKPESTAIMILTPSASTFKSEIEDKNLKSRDITICYKPKLGL